MLTTFLRHLASHSHPPFAALQVDWKKLHSQVRWNKPEVVQHFTAELLNTHDDRNGNCAIHIAAQNGHTDMVRDILKVDGVDVNTQNNGGQTALHMAIEYGYDEAVSLLQAAGADGTIVNQAGHAASTGIEGTK